MKNSLTECGVEIQKGNIRKRYDNKGEIVRRYQRI